MSMIYLIRHARTKSNQLGRYMGRIDEDIDPSQLFTTIAVADRLANVGIAKIYSSPLIRAKRTAAPLAEALGLGIVERSAFTELAMGPWEGMTQQEIAESFPSEWEIWRNRPAALTIPGRENLQALSDRVVDALSSVFEPGPPVAIFAHDTVIRVALLFALGLPITQYRLIEVANCSISAIELAGGKAVFKILPVVSANHTAEW